MQNGVKIKLWESAAEFSFQLFLFWLPDTVCEPCLAIHCKGPVGISEFAARGGPLASASLLFKKNEVTKWGANDATGVAVIS